MPSPDLDPTAAAEEVHAVADRLDERGQRPRAHAGDGMTPADCWVPVPLRWRHVIPGDVIVGRDGRPWMVTSTGTAVTAVDGPTAATQPVDPDDPIPVLVPVTDRDAVELTRDQLGARLVERRTT